MTIYKNLRKKYGHRNVRLKTSPFRSRKIEDSTLISDIMKYWNVCPKFQWPDQPWYTGSGLHYSSDSLIFPLEKQICGNEDSRAEYQDTLKFDQTINPNLLGRFQSFPTVRCKITEMKNNNLSSALQSQASWHKDESPYEVLRVIIPLKTDMTYQFQMNNDIPEFLIPGYAYAFDQSRYHRVFSLDPSDSPRTHLILSFVTWFNKIDNDWVPNEFFGNVHPLDLFDLIPL